jgi:hypothetical protein
VKRKLHPIELLWGLFFALAVFAAADESPWEALRHLPKHHVYTVLSRNGACVTGSFVSTNDKEITLSVVELGQRSLSRSDVLRISLGETPDIHSTVYSSRSSWPDLEALETPPYYSDLLIVTSDNRQFRGPLLGISSDQITLVVDGLEMRFAKAYVDRVFLTSVKPTFELGLHRSLIRPPKKVTSPVPPVPLYEVNTSQDNRRQ